MNKVIVRSLSGIVYIAFIVGAILLGKWAFLALTSLLTVLGVIEFTNMAHKPFGDRNSYLMIECVDIAFALLVCLSSWLINYDLYSICGSCLMTIVVLMVYFLVRSILALTDHGEHAYRETAKSVLAIFYIAMPMYMLNMLYATSLDTWQIVLIMFIMIWLNDTGAFCFGSTLGKHRLCERLSPKKSWEGFWGGMACCVAFGALCFWQFNSLELPLVVWLIFGALVSVFATWGDLFESMLKRTVNVKDSGNIMPGHGGILDRIDSLLFVAPATTVCLITYFLFFG